MTTKNKKEFGDYNFDINKIKGYNFPENSEFSKDIANSPDFHNILKKHKNEIIKDYRDDQQANTYGRNKGLQNKDVNCKILVNKYRPNGLNKKY